MNDNIIISTISKIHFILVSILSFIFLSLSILFILLQNGLYIDEFSSKHLNFKQLYIKWDEKISIVAKEISVQNKNRSDNDGINTGDMFKNIYSFSNIFDKVVIEKVSYNDIRGSINFIKNRNGYINLTSNDFLLDTKIASNSTFVDIYIDNLIFPKKALQINGNIVVSSKDNTTVTSSLQFNINNNKIDIYTHSNYQKTTYRINSDNNINSIREIVDLFGNNLSGKYWYYDAIDMSSLTLLNAYGWIDHSKVDEAFKNIHARALVNNLKYKYDKKLEAIDTTETYIEFLNGILYIKPNNAYTYGFYLDKSWVKIDFTTKDEILTVKLLFNGKADENLHKILNRYGVTLPFTQTFGDLHTDLKILINLITEDVSAKGSFKTNHGKIDYLGLNIDVFDADIKLDNSHVIVKNMLAKYKDIASSYVDIDFNGKNSKGFLDFRVDKLNFKDYKLTLNEDKRPLRINYKISPKQDYINIKKSELIFQNDPLTVSEMNIPFDINKLSAEIPLTELNIENKLSAKAIGSIDMKSNGKKLDINIEISKLKYKNIELKQNFAYFNLSYNKNMYLFTNNPLNLNILDKKIKLDKFNASINKNEIKTKNVTFKLDDTLTSKISTFYNPKKSNGYVKFHKIKVKDKTFGKILNDNRGAKVDFKISNDSIDVKSDIYGIKYYGDNNRWSLSLNSLEKLYNYSNILKKYDLDNGSIYIHKDNYNDNIEFKIDTKYKYKILATKDNEITDYTLKGIYNTNKNVTNMTLNKTAKIQISDKISIDINDIGINIKDTLKLIDMLKSNNNKKGDTKLNLTANNSHIYINEKRSALADNVILNYSNDVLSAKIRHGNGKAVFKMKNNNFDLYGENFNDKFMSKIFTFSKFKSGRLSFSVSGKPDEFVGSIHTKNTRIVDYKILNNVLAFINTVPSLLTFQVPGYNTKGLKAENAYINFQLKDDLYTISDIYLKSKEIDILGVGKASIKNDTIDIDLNIETDLGSSVSKIPVVGYILLGKDNISTSVSVTGKLSDPQVNSQIVKDIAVGPINIIKRTLTLPFELFKEDEKK